jgi:thymidylate synthase ThyX
MKIVNQSYKIMSNFNNPLKDIEIAARTCYKSENKIGCTLENPDEFCSISEKLSGNCDNTNCEKHSSHKLIKSLVKNNHEAMLEFLNIYVKFITNRGVTHELVRHRLFSFAQECVIGSTLIKTGSGTKTIKELYDQKYNGTHYDRTHFKTQNIKSVDDEKRIINNKIKDVFKTGKKDVFKVKTSLGYEITCTKNHKFLTECGDYIELSQLKVNNSIMVNGRTSLLKLHYDWWVGKKVHPDKIVSIDYVGEEETYDIEMGEPFHNYIANGLVTHNSTRYVNYNNKEMEFIRPVWCSEQVLGKHTIEWVNMIGHRLEGQINPELPPADNIWFWNQAIVERDYCNLLSCNWRPEQAREILPNSLKTEINVKGNAREWMHCLKLRTSKKSHPQIRALMLPLLNELKTKVPIIFDNI